MTAAIALAVEFAQINCGECGGVYCITENYRESKEKNSASWHCPYCQTGWGYAGDNSYKAKLEAEKKRHQASLARLNEAVHTLELERKKAVRLRKRVQAGVCICCNRTFVNLARHMKCKHPEKAPK